LLRPCDQKKAAGAGSSPTINSAGQPVPTDEPHPYENGPLTVNVAVAFLTDMLLTDGLTNILNGTPSSDDTNILDTVGQELENYSGSKLSADAEQFAHDEQSYDRPAPWM
jgi:hypothetical protein